MNLQFIYRESESTISKFPAVLDIDITEASRWWSFVLSDVEHSLSPWEFVVTLTNIRGHDDTLSLHYKWDDESRFYGIRVFLHDETEAGSLRMMPWTADLVITAREQLLITVRLRHRGYIPEPYIDINQIAPR